MHLPDEASDTPRRLPLPWAIVPVVGIGMLSWAPFLYAAVNTGARKYKLLTAFYLGIAIVIGTLLAIQGNHHNGLENVVGFLVIVSSAAGAVHTLAIRREYGRLLASNDDPRLAAAQQQIDTRQRALQIVRTDPKRAVQLGIGRPDVPGSFDAGLIDVNHVGPDVLQTLPGIDAARARRICELRMNGTGFQSAADLDMVVDLDPGTLTELSERAVFLPRFI